MITAMNRPDGPQAKLLRMTCVMRPPARRVRVRPVSPAVKATRWQRAWVGSTCADGEQNAVPPRMT